MKLVSAIFATAISVVPVTQNLQNQNGWRPAWALDRIDQRESTLNDKYTYSYDGTGVSVYVVDSGINASHEEFDSRVSGGFSAVNDGLATGDCAGHGTHTAGIIGGKTYGVAKGVSIIPVRVLNCSSNGSFDSILAGMKWIIEHHQDGVPAVVNLSVGSNRSIPFNELIRALIADGVIVVAAAGNQNKDACLYSPASETSAIVVGSVRINGAKESLSNTGSCIDIFAPGSDVVAPWFDSPKSYRSTSGTSNAAPVVSGIVATMLQRNPAMSQSDVEQALTSNATKDVLSGIGTGSPNLLAYSVIDAPVQTPTSTTSTIAPATTTTTVPVTTTTIAPTTTTTVIPATTVAKAMNPQPTTACTIFGRRTIVANIVYVCARISNKMMWVRVG